MRDCDGAKIFELSEKKGKKTHFFLIALSNATWIHAVTTDSNNPRNKVSP